TGPIEQQARIAVLAAHGAAFAAAAQGTHEVVGKFHKPGSSATRSITGKAGIYLAVTMLTELPRRAFAWLTARLCFGRAARVCAAGDGQRISPSTRRGG